MTVTGPDFLALQVRDLERAATFYETYLGLGRIPTGPPGAVVFDTTPIPFAVREPSPGIDLDAADAQPGLGVALWLHADDAQQVHDRLVDAGVPVLVDPSTGRSGEPSPSPTPTATPSPCTTRREGAACLQRPMAARVSRARAASPTALGCTGKALTGPTRGSIQRVSAPEQASWPAERV